MDKGATSPISIMGWQEDVGAEGQDFALTSTVLWIGLVAGNPIVGIVSAQPLCQLQLTR